MTITTLSINGTDYTSYATLAEADARLAIDPVRGAAWVALGETARQGLLVAATYRLDLLPWLGEKTGGASQANAFPRTGLTYKDGTTVSTSEVPLEVQDATILLAGSIAVDPSAANDGSSGSNIEEVQAGSARVKFFRPVAGAPLQDAFAYQLVACFLGSGANLFGSASGTTGTSSFLDSEEFGLSEGYP